MTRPAVVVLGLDCPTGLQAARVFAARGVSVIGIAADRRHPCTRTRSCRSIVGTRAHPDAMLDTLMTVGASLDEPAVLLPCTDQAVLCVSRHRDSLAPRYRLAVPTLETIELLLDKARFADFAAARGLPIPDTYVVRNLDGAKFAAHQVRYPCVLKPSVKSADWTEHVPWKAVVAESPPALVSAYERHARWAEAFVVQEWVEGEDDSHFTCDCYLNETGDALVTFTSQKLRQWPPGVGQGCLSVEARNPAVCEETLRVLRAAGHFGPGYVELKRDRQSGRHVIIEANVGRPTGRSAAAEKAGVELLMTMYCDLVGAPLPTQRTQTFRGTKWIHIRRDVQACARLWLTGRTGLREILGSWRGPMAFALFSWRDPVPFLADWLRVLLAASKQPFLRAWNVSGIGESVERQDDEPLGGATRACPSRLPRERPRRGQRTQRSPRAHRG